MRGVGPSKSIIKLYILFYTFSMLQTSRRFALLRAGGHPAIRASGHRPLFGGLLAPTRSGDLAGTVEWPSRMTVCGTLLSRCAVPYQDSKRMSRSASRSPDATAPTTLPLRCLSVPSPANPSLPSHRGFPSSSRSSGLASFPSAIGEVVAPRAYGFALQRTILPSIGCSA